MNFLPAGVRFVPDDELVVGYLMEKIKNPQYNSCEFIKDVNVNEYDPETITDLYPSNGKNEWYFFSVQEASINRQGAKRRAGNGYWRASVANKAVSYDCGIVAYRKGLEYWRGNPSKGEKTLWLMHEYTVGIASQTSLQHGVDNIGSTQMDKWSVCKIYKSKRKSNNIRKSEVYDGGELEVAASNGSRPRVEQAEASRIELIHNSSNHHVDPMIPARFGVGEYICSESATNYYSNDQENGVVSRSESWDMVELENLLNEENKVVSRSESWDMEELDKLLNEENEVVSRSES